MAKIAELKPGDIMDMVAFVTFSEFRQNNGNSWIKLLVKDITGEIAVMLFDFSEEACKDILKTLETNKWMQINGVVESFKGAINVKAKDIEFVSAPANLSDYFHACPRSFDWMISDLEMLIDQINDPGCKEAIIFTLGKNGYLRKKFEIWPAAKSKHHAYTNGLLEHTLEVAKFAIRDLEDYPKINKDVLITAALFHDLGKIDEYAVDESNQISITQNGTLMPHLPKSGAIAYHAFRNVSATDLETQVLHCILTHHGRIEWGNSFEFKIKEAELLYLADHKSCVLNRIEVK
jgi:3'-5' exoribonuclease